MLEVKISEDLKTSLKEGDKTSVSALRMLISEIKNRKIEKIAKSLDDADVIALVQKMIRQHKESIEQFRQGKREDLVKKETDEMAALEKYLPAQMTEKELDGIIAQVISDLGASSAKDMGSVMKEVMKKTSGMADGKVISQKVKEKLSGN